MAYESICDFSQIDLGRHGLIEASAGTGKTHTIENLVLRLLKERDDVELENILLVTFTEKAVSELKIRIREKLEGELNVSENNPRETKKLRDTLDAFDRASIFTIHGFCQTVLMDFAFENSTPFQSEVINDTPIFERLLKEQMRKKWPKIYGESLGEVLEVSQFDQKKGRFLETVIGLAKSLHEAAGDGLLPDLKGRGFGEIKQDIEARCWELKALLGSGEEFSQGFAQLNFNARTKKSIHEKMVIPIEEYFSKSEEQNFDIRALSDLMAKIEGIGSGGSKGLECLIPEKWNRDRPNPEVCPNLDIVRQKLQELNGTLDDLRNTLAVEAIHCLQDDVLRAKQGHGWISYYDMLAFVEKTLQDDRPPNLAPRLRKRFKVAFIDEFQDTDPIQWKIFKRIFIDDPEDSLASLLFVIGDPKQAIYSFRGADVYAYLSARNEMERLEKRGKARLYSLSINWRSEPEMITAFNNLFCGEAWFRPQERAGEFEIGYQRTGFPGERERPRVMIEDDSCRPVLNIVDLSRSPSPRTAKVMLAGLVANEIGHLISSHIKIREKGGEEREIDFGDICVLVRGRSDVPFIEEELIRLGIPYTFYKKPGLFLSDEAVHIGLVFHAVLDPGDGSAVKKALLTPFFGFERSGLFAYEEMPASHPVKQILFKWNRYGMSRRWSHLFQSMVEDSGLLSRETVESGWDRRYTNYRQIFEYLEDVAYRRGLDFRGLSAILDVYRRQPSDVNEDVDIHQIDTEARKVQVMTMHVSKGLEFPVVFVAGGLTQPPSHLEQYHTYHAIRKNGSSPEAIRIVDLTRMGGGGRHEVEKLDENKRLYYVASTRAQFKLYLPFYLYEKKASWLGPVCTLLSRALLEAFPQKEPNKNVLWLTADHRSGALTEKIKLEKPWGQTTIPIGGAFEPFPFQGSYQHRRLGSESFSSLHQKMARPLETYGQEISFHAAPFKGKEDDEGFASQGIEAVSIESEPREIPGGTEVGLMFHEILEHMDYQIVSKKGATKGGSSQGLMDDPGTRDVILRQMELHRINPRWKDQICDTIWNTLTTPVADDFFLSHLKKEDRLHEVEFYYSFPVAVTTPYRIPHCEVTNGLIRGFVDLVFRKDQKFYIADWKSNYLETGYDLESLEKNMDQADYHLQYKLYAIGVLRWLRQTIGDRFDPERHFGGVLYFYLRGMGTGEGHGIYYVPQGKLGSLDQLEQEVWDRLYGNDGVLTN